MHNRIKRNNSHKKLKQKKILNFFIPKKENGIGQWLAEEGISAGFPSPADDFKETRISLDRELVKNKKQLFTQELVETQ